MKRKKGAIERCVIGGFPTKQAAIAEDGSRETPLGVMKHKTTLGLD
jgi:hypothetical protein